MLRLTGNEARREQMVRVRGDETLTTRVKAVDCAKARLHLGHKATVSLEDGIRQTIEWMRKVYAV